MSAEQHFLVGQVASRTQVSVRTLHHYDDIGLLHPSMRLESGRRLYSSTDVLKLQQILTLRYLGFELRQIGELLERPDFDVLASLRIQRKAVRDRIEQLLRIDASLARLLDGHISSGLWDWTALADASAAVQEKGPKMDEYYTPEQIRLHTDELARGERGEELHALEREWRLLLREMHANPDLPPESRMAAEFVDRWDDIHERARPLFQGDTKLWQSLGRAHLDGQYNSIEDAAHAARRFSRRSSARMEAPAAPRRLGMTVRSAAHCATSSSRKPGRSRLRRTRTWLQNWLICKRSPTA